jgi:hypothetical protein
MIRNVQKITMWTPKNAYTQVSAMLSPWDAIRWVFAWMVASSLPCSTRKVCPSPHLLFMILGAQPTHLPVGNPEALFTKIRGLSEFIHQCFNRSSRKDQLIDVVRESIATGIWHPCLQDLDNWSDWERFAALELLVVAGGLSNNVLDCSFLLPNFTQLRHWFHRLNTRLRQPRILSCS